MNSHDVVNRAFDLLNKIAFLDRRNTFDPGTGMRLHSSEIHAILAIALHPDTNVTQLAETLGITKGAISQTLSRLQQKEVIHTEKIPHTRNERKIVFTAHGLSVAADLQRWIRRRHAGLLKYLERLPEEKLRVISDFLAAVEDVVVEK